MSEKCGKILKNIFIDAVVLERDECSIDGETLVLCFLEELGDLDDAQVDDLGNAEGNSNWKSLVDTVVQDTGGYSSDVSHDIIADIERQGGEAFLKMALEEFNNMENDDPFDALEAGMKCKGIEDVSGEYMDAEILSVDRGSRIVEVLFTDFGKRQKLTIDELSLPLETTGEDWHEVGEGKCGICCRTLPLTAHHLIPKKTHSFYLKKGTYTRDQLNRCVDLCRACHSKVHKTEDEKSLAENYNTIELLLAHPDIKKFAKYMYKQKSTKHNNDTRLVPKQSRRKKDRR